MNHHFNEEIKCFSGARERKRSMLSVEASMCQ